MSISADTSTATYVLPMTASSTFVGNNTISAIAGYMVGASSYAWTSWVSLGTWAPYPPQNVPPQASQASPSSGSGASQSFQFALSDVNGYRYLNYVWLAFVNGSNSCWFYYYAGANCVQMSDSAGNYQWAYLDGSVYTYGPGSPFCSLGTPAVNASGNNLTLTLPLSFALSFAGSINISGWVYDKAWQGAAVPASTWMVGNPVPALATISPTSATAGSGAFTLTVNGSNFIGSSVVRWNGSGRTTTYFGPTQLSAAVSAADVASAGTATVTVFNPTPGGGTSGSAPFTINNPAPSLTGLSPTSATAGSGAFTLTVNGNNFVGSSVVRWNGSGRTTTYLGPTQLSAAVSAADVASAGTATVTVFNPAPGGGTSSPATFTINSSNPPPVIATNSPLPGGTIGMPYSQSLAASSGQPPYAWSSTSLPAGLALNPVTGLLSGTPSTTGTFSITVTVTDSSSPLQQTGSKALSLSIIPAQWKGINYSPRHHQYFRMLYDWYDWDSGAGKYVYQMVDDDLQRLRDNGFNLIHLYLWDHKLLMDSLLELTHNPNAYEPSGFTDSPGHPNPSGNQWSALDAFVGKAESKGIYVALHFASGRFLDLVESTTDPEAAATEFANWAAAFIQYLTPAHKNVLIWGLAWSVEPSFNEPLGSWSLKWQKAYKKLNDIARESSPSPGNLGLVGADLAQSMFVYDPSLYDPTDPGKLWPPQPAGDVLPRGGGYQWDWRDSQKTAKTMHDLLTSIYGGSKDPEAYLMQLYTANATDIQNALQSLTTNNGGDPSRLAVPANKIFAVEWATSSAIGNPYDNPSGAAVAAIGDFQTPTTTAAGQSQWLTNAICAYRNAGINKYAYWAMYDPYTLFSTSPFNMTGQELAWWAFWGIVTDSGVDKPGWTALRNFYMTDPSSWSCPSPAPPVVSLVPTNNYFTISQPVRATWTAADVTSMSLDRSHAGSYSCVSGLQLSGTDLAGSCAYTDATPFYTPGTQTVTLTGFNGSQSATASASIPVYLNPVVNAATNQDYQSTIHANDWIIVWGNGFSVTGGNSLQFTRPGYDDVWWYDGCGYGFWDLSYWQINAQVAGRLAAGTWTLYVRNGYSSNPSAEFTVTITQ